LALSAPGKGATMSFINFNIFRPVISWPCFIWVGSVDFYTVHSSRPELFASVAHDRVCQCSFEGFGSG
jgi:hypothetical protein